MNEISRLLFNYTFIFCLFISLLAAPCYVSPLLFQFSKCYHHAIISFPHCYLTRATIPFYQFSLLLYNIPLLTLYSLFLSFIPFKMVSWFLCNMSPLHDHLSLTTSFHYIYSCHLHRTCGHYSPNLLPIWYIMVLLPPSLYPSLPSLFTLPVFSLYSFFLPSFITPVVYSFLSFHSIHKIIMFSISPFLSRSIPPYPLHSSFLIPLFPLSLETIKPSCCLVLSAYQWLSLFTASQRLWRVFLLPSHYVTTKYDVFFFQLAFLERKYMNSS